LCRSESVGDGLSCHAIITGPAVGDAEHSQRHDGGDRDRRQRDNRATPAKQAYGAAYRSQA
jgi:hypothetical protein